MRRLSLSSLKDKAWNLFSMYIRLKAADEGGTVECYTCGKLMFWKGDGAQAGHAIPGRNNAVLFDEDLVKVQCEGCNVWKRGNHHIFTAKLIKEHGMKWWDRKEFESRKTIKWTAADMQDRVDLYKAKLSELTQKEAA
jgi:hypothetical protein